MMPKKKVQRRTPTIPFLQRKFSKVQKLYIFYLKFILTYNKLYIYIYSVSQYMPLSEFYKKNVSCLHTT